MAGLVATKKARSKEVGLGNPCLQHQAHAHAMNPLLTHITLKGGKEKMKLRKGLGHAEQAPLIMLKLTPRNLIQVQVLWVAMLILT